MASPQLLWLKPWEQTEKLDKAVADGAPGLEKRELMDALRETIDTLESLVPKDVWPVPSYAEMLFVL